jgi:hypothetical protein
MRQIEPARLRAGVTIDDLAEAPPGALLRVHANNA